MKDEMETEEENVLRIANMRDPGNRFVVSCKRFYRDKGFLSNKQINALMNVRCKRNHQFFGGDDDHDYWAGYSGGLNGDPV